MGRYFIIAIMLYALVVGIYLLWERGVKRKRNAARKKGYNPFKPSAKEDIIGKSKFVLGQGRTKATILEISGKSEEKQLTFADGNEQTHVQDTPGETPATEVENVVLPQPTEDNSGDIDIVIYDEPEGEIESDEDDSIDYDETEEAGETSGSGKSIGTWLRRSFGSDPDGGKRRRCHTGRTGRSRAGTGRSAKNRTIRASRQRRTEKENRILPYGRLFQRLLSRQGSPTPTCGKSPNRF